MPPPPLRSAAPLDKKMIHGKLDIIYCYDHIYLREIGTNAKRKYWEGRGGMKIFNALNPPPSRKLRPCHTNQCEINAFLLKCKIKNISVVDKC